MAWRASSGTTQQPVTGCATKAGINHRDATGDLRVKAKDLDRQRTEIGQ
jgi:hypothetical protein